MFILLVSYVLLDNLLMGTFRIEFVLAMFISGLSMSLLIKPSLKMKKMN